MARATGIGGVFLRSKDPKRLSAWYIEHLGLPATDWGVSFDWKDEVPAGTGQTAWSTFPADTKYFGEGEQPFMINYRVDDLLALLAALRAEGVQVDQKVEESEFGKFGWVIDPEGNKVELWQPPAGQ